MSCSSTFVRKKQPGHFGVHATQEHFAGGDILVFGRPRSKNGVAHYKRPARGFLENANGREGAQRVEARFVKSKIR